MKTPGFLLKKESKSYLSTLNIIDFLVALMEVVDGLFSIIAFTSPMKAPESNSSNS